MVSTTAVSRRRGRGTWGLLGVGMADGHGSKMARKREAALTALLTHSSIAQAAQAADVDEKTLDRWLKDEAFAADYRAARQRVVEEAVGLLQKATTAAAATLMRNLKCGTPAVEVRAALGIFDLVLKAATIEEQEARLAELEALMSGLRPEPAALTNGRSR